MRSPARFICVLFAVLCLCCFSLWLPGRAATTFTVNSLLDTGDASPDGACDDGAGNCTLLGGSVHITGAGSCTITARQDGDETYNAAPDVSRSFNINKASQTINFGTLFGKTFGDAPFDISATGGGSGNPVTFESQTPTICSLSGSTVTILGAGTCTIRASQAGNTNYNDAASVDGSLTITVTRNGETTSPATVDYTTDDGSNPSVFVPCSATTGAALDRCDYERALGTLRFAAGVREQRFTVLVNDDSYVEGTETTLLRLSNPTGGAALASTPTATLEITDDVPESTGNPIDDDEAFVAQHYRDFLNRAPDPAGLKFWTDGIKACGNEQQCREVKRIHTSAAFFRSIEFQQTGCLVYRMHKSAADNVAGTPVPVRLNDFLRDTQQIGLGVVVGEAGWEQRLAENKAAFALAFVQRPEFLARYPASTSAVDFVNALDANAGGVLTSQEKDALVAELSPNPSDASLRASVLRQVAENSAFALGEFNLAFVLMEYFGYLRRDPDAAPNTNFDGYNFWLGKLNDFNGDFVRAEMVKAFLDSVEYRNRFAQ